MHLAPAVRTIEGSPGARMLSSSHLIPTFEDLVDTAMQVEGVDSSDATRRYLVHLLVAFSRPEGTTLLDHPLGPALVAAMSLPPIERHGQLRRVGDTTLFLAGLFVEYLERTAVGPEYYVALGRTAYAHLSDDCHNRSQAGAYAELAARFVDFVRVLAVIAERHLFTGSSDLLRVYRRWAANRSPRAAATLIRNGLIPVSPDAGTRFKH